MTGSVTSLLLRFYLPVRAYPTDKLVITGAEEVIIPAALQRAQQCTRSSTQGSASVNCNIATSQSTINLCEGLSHCDRKEDYTIGIGNLKVKSLASQLKGTMQIRVLTAKDEVIAQGDLPLESLPDNFITPNVFRNFQISTEPSSCQKVSERCDFLVL